MAKKEIALVDVHSELILIRRLLMAALQKSGTSQRDLGRMLGIDQADISRMLGGKK
jgi:hypothetical protein